MKTSARFFLSLILTALFAGSCHDPLDGFVLGIKDPIAEAKLEIRASSTSVVLPEDIETIFAGPDAGQIVTVLNTRKFRINKEGNLFVAVNPAVTPTQADPVDFTFTANAEGFTRIIRAFSFTDKTNKTFSARFFHMNTPPKGVSANQFELRQEQAASFKTSGPDKQEEVKIEIASGTSFADGKEENLSGELTLVVHHFDNRSARSYLPTGGIANNALNENGTTITDPFDLPQLGGFASIQISSENHEIASRFSQPLTLTFDLNPSLVNPDTKAAIKEGDLIPYMSFDDYKNLWKVEGKVKIEKDGQTAKLVARVPAARPAYYITGWPRKLCRLGPRFSIRSKLTDVDLTFFCQVIGARSGNVVRTLYVNANNGSTFTINNFPEDHEDVRIRIFNYNNIYGGDQKTPLYESPVVAVCSNLLTSADLAPLPVPSAINVEYTISCPAGKTLDEAALPALTRTQFSEPGKNQWRDLVNLTRTTRKVKTYKLQVGKTYDLRASTDGGSTWPYRQSDYLIDKKDWIFKFRDLDYCK